MSFGGMDRRKFERKPISMQVRYRSMDTFFYDYALNLSHGGIFIKTRRPLARGVEVELEFEIPSSPRVFRTRGRVARVIAAGDDEFEPAGMGIQFDALAEEDKALIDSLWKDAAKDGEAAK